MHDCKLTDEDGRLAALNRYEVLDTGPERPFDKITGLVQSVLDVPIAAVSLVDVHRQWFKSIQGLDVAETGRDVAFCHHTIRQRAPMLVPDAAVDPRFADNPLVTGAPHIRAYAGAPLETPDGYNLGALCAIDQRPRRFDDGQTAILTSFAKLVVDELELRQVASTDGLTGALSRRAFVEAAEEEMQRARRYGRPLALAIFDLDRFKRVNDAYGHPAGDAVLRAVAAVVNATLRRNDSLGRLGGEEFAILLPETDAEAALTVAERVRRAIAEARPDIGARRLPVTASFGLCPLADRHADVEGWLAAADNALYEAKTSGRDRTRLAPGGPIAAQT